MAAWGFGFGSYHQFYSVTLQVFITKGRRRETAKEGILDL
jgi:hypothetical protein